MIVSDQYMGVCHGCGQTKRVCHYSDDDSVLCDKCLVAQAKYRDKQHALKWCPPRHWREAFPEIAAKLDAKDNNRK